MKIKDTLDGKLQTTVIHGCRQDAETWEILEEKN